MKLSSNYRFLDGIIPNNWETNYSELVYNFCCAVYTREETSDSEIETLIIKIKSEFGIYFNGVYTHNNYYNINRGFTVIIRKAYIMHNRNKKIDKILM